MVDLDTPETIAQVKMGIRVLLQQAQMRDRLGASEAALGHDDKAAEYAAQALALRVSAEALTDLIEG